MARYVALLSLFLVVLYQLDSTAGATPDRVRCFDRTKITLAETNSVIEGWKNSGACTCEEAKALVNKPGSKLNLLTSKIVRYFANDISALKLFSPHLSQEYFSVRIIITIVLQKTIMAN